MRYGYERLSTGSRRIAGLAVDADGTVFVCDSADNQIRAVHADGSREVLLGAPGGTAGFAGDNVAAAASWADGPVGLVRDRRGVLYFCDPGNARLRYFHPGGRAYTLVGGGSDAGDEVALPLNARLEAPAGLCMDEAGTVYFVERPTGRVRRLAPGGRLVTLATLLPGEGGPVAVDTAGKRLWAAEGSRLHLFTLESVPGRRLVLDLPVEQTVEALASDGADGLYALVSMPDGAGRRRAEVWLLAGDLPAPIRLAGRRIDGEPIDYSGGPVSLPDARDILLPGAGVGALCIEGQNPADSTQRSEVIYLAANYDDGAATRWGEAARLTPGFW